MGLCEVYSSTRAFGLFAVSFYPKCFQMSYTVRFDGKWNINYSTRFVVAHELRFYPMHASLGFVFEVSWSTFFRLGV